MAIGAVILSMNQSAHAARLVATVALAAKPLDNFPGERNPH
jgi:hypothetical protein